MSEFAEFLQTVLTDGRIVLTAPPDDVADAFAVRILQRAYEIQLLSIAGPPMPMDAEVALAAGRVLQWSAWSFLNPGLAIDNAERRLLMPKAPTSLAQHLSADLCLRFLPVLYRRARTQLHDDILPRHIRQTLCDWPLSGVLSDIAESPTAPIDFGPHAGVNFLYAERLARNTRSSWMPRGIAREYAELVWRDLGRDASIFAEPMVDSR